MHVYIKKILNICIKNLTYKYKKSIDKYLKKCYNVYRNYRCILIYIARVFTQKLITNMKGG